jgi:hypothetical protein
MYKLSAASWLPLRGLELWTIGDDSGSVDRSAFKGSVALFARRMSPAKPEKNPSVGLVGEAVIGYHTLAVGQVSLEEAPERLTKGLARHPVPMFAENTVGGRPPCYVRLPTEVG